MLTPPSPFTPKHAKGVVVWDKSVRSSLIVAFTIAGVEDLVAVTADQLPLAAKHGLQPVVDLRGKFTGQTDAPDLPVGLRPLFRALLPRLLRRDGRPRRCRDAAGRRRLRHPSARLLHRPVVQPEASRGTRPPEKNPRPPERPASIVLGWHSYAKDTEGQHTTLVGNYGLIMEGLHNLPNVSFTSQIPLTPDFKFTNHHTVKPGATRAAEKKVYIAAVSTDAMGIGTWTKPGRGKIPYSWQVLMNWAWMNPPALQYFYEDKSPNDYFIGGLSGPGYMYPKAIPADKWPALIPPSAAI
jgi:hypothetical protein